MAAGQLKAVVATSTLDLGIDWGDIDLVINVGAPKGASRLLQRIGRANHRLDEPSKALLVPSNRFEVLECRAALDAARAGQPGCRSQPDRRARRAGAARHGDGSAPGRSWPMSCSTKYARPRPMRRLTRATFERVVDFVATGGYALRPYETVCAA